mmetsp:Transcript_15066/g.35726  ORF Transcript_15066/g.35726 Transcript_15066/m.35726 type:complete len:294 (-) Transcript_15066:88-969(-)
MVHQQGHLLHLGQPARVAAAVGLLMMLAHGLQPFGVCDPGHLQQRGAAFGMGLDFCTLQRGQRRHLGHQPVLQFGHRHIHRQRGAQRAAPLLGRPAQPARGQAGSRRGVHRMSAGIAAIQYRGVVGQHGLKDGEVGVAFDQGQQRARGLVQRLGEVQRCLGAQQPRHLAHALFPVGRQLLGPGLLDAAGAVDHLAHVDRRLALDQPLKLFEVVELVAARQQQSALGVEDAIRRRLAGREAMAVNMQRLEVHDFCRQHRACSCKHRCRPNTLFLVGRITAGGGVGVSIGQSGGT